MLTLTFQSVAALLKMVFVAVALALQRSARSEAGPDTTSWRCVTAAFLVSGVSGAIQAAWAVAAVHGGTASATYQLYLSAMPAMNYSRFGVATALGVALAVLPFRAEQWSRLRFSALLTFAVSASAVGVLGGLMETSFDPGIHATRVAMLQFVETAVLLIALVVAVLRSSMDTWLWLALFVYAFRQALNSLLWAAAARGFMPGQWHPPFWITPLIGVVVWMVMIVLVWRRLTLARRGIPVHPTFAVPDPATRDSFRSLG